MDLFNMLGDALRPSQPANWPVNSPAYHSKAGWELEKKLALMAILFKIKDAKACALVQRAAELQEIAIAGADTAMFWKYNDIVVRLIEYRRNLLIRYNPCTID